MNLFDQKLKEHKYYPLKAEKITTIQVNVGYKCNLSCTHCHVEASPARTESMSSETIEMILTVLRNHNEVRVVDITGGSPEMNANFKHFVRTAADMGKEVIVRSNLTILADPAMEDLPGFLAKKKVKIIASLPCYTEQGVDSQRGKGTYQKAIYVFKRLNALGYGKGDTSLEIDIMFNPAGAEIAPDQNNLENTYREKIKEMHGIVFNHLIALSNMPIGKLMGSMSNKEVYEYMSLLKAKFNPHAVNNLMCRNLINVSPGGKLFDCDFWQMLNMPVNNGSSHISKFDFDRLKNRKIVTNNLCFLCTAGAGAGCSGALA